MPKDTFFNLTDEKRHLIENTAITEFAARGFDKASINIIVQNSGIAKGSFYQYFADKKDLFLHIIIEVAARRKLQYMSPAVRNPEGVDFFTIIKELFISGLRFAGENPELEKLGMWLTNNTNHPVYREMMERAGKLSFDIYEQLVSAAVRRGELRSDLDADYIIHIFPVLITSTMDYCLMQARGKRDGVSDISDDVLEEVDLMIDFLKQGIGSR